MLVFDVALVASEHSGLVVTGLLVLHNRAPKMQGHISPALVALDLDGHFVRLGIVLEEVKLLLRPEAN